ncbi:hypothetical protein M1N82_02525 [Dehalococcoidia bacterium]|nr:hypothetical protein [Dehalococcoidia bacterium]MCL0091089.1 hypothetical protein [Dehalococcoidia bacterium]
MKITLNKSIRDEKGQAMILVLILLLVGGLIIAPLLGFMSTGLMAGQTLENKMKEFYAADAGIEYGLWKLTKGQDTWDEAFLPQVNRMQVRITRQDLLIPGKIAQAWFDGDTQQHYGSVADNPAWPCNMRVQMSHPGGFADYEYKFEITIENRDILDIIWGAELMQMTAVLPPGFTYVEVLDSDIITQPGVIYDFEISGDGLKLTWNFPDEYNRPVIVYSPQTEYRHSFKVTGPPGIENFDEESYSYSAQMIAVGLGFTVSKITAYAGDPDDPDVEVIAKDFRHGEFWEQILAWIMGWEGLTVFQFNRYPTD